MTSPADKDALVRQLQDVAINEKLRRMFPVLAAELDRIAIALLTAPAEAEPVAMVAGYFSGRCVVSPVTPAVLPAGMALYAAPLPQSAPVSRDAVIEECAKVCDEPCIGMDDYLRIQNHVVKREVDIEIRVRKDRAAAIRSLAAHPAEPAGKGKRPEFFSDLDVIHGITRCNKHGGYGFVSDCDMCKAAPEFPAAGSKRD